MTHLTAKPSITGLCVEIDVTRAAEPLIDQIARAVADDPSLVDTLTELATALGEAEHMHQRAERGQVADWRADSAQARADALREEVVNAVLTEPVTHLLNRREALELAAALESSADTLTAPMAQTGGAR